MLERCTALLDDLVVRTDGLRREIVAYAAVFDRGAEIIDADGHYIETIDRAGFDRSIGQKQPEQFTALVNHGKDLYGKSSERFALPYGVPSEISADGRGLLTVTRASKTPLGDESLELARDGAFNGFSFTAKAIRSDPQPPAHGDLGTIHRQELALIEFGPAVFPAYDDATILAVRQQTLGLTADQIAAALEVLPDDEREALVRSLADTHDGPASGPTADGPEARESDPANTGHSVPTRNERRKMALRLKGITSDG